VGPQVITRQDDRGHKLEPFEDAIIEVPEEHMGQARGCARSPVACRRGNALQATGRIQLKEACGSLRTTVI